MGCVREVGLMGFGGRVEDNPYLVGFSNPYLVGFFGDSRPQSEARTNRALM
jgi:hypothetical protein